MANFITLVLIKGERVLAEKTDNNNTFKLPEIVLMEEEQPQEAIYNWLKGKVLIKGEKVIQSDTLMNDGIKSKHCILMDVTGGEGELSSNDNLVWLDNSELRQLDIFHNRVIKRVLEQCSEEEYFSYGVKSLETSIEKSSTMMNYFKDYRNTLYRKKVDTESHNNKKIWAILFSLATAILFSIFFYDSYFGISYGIFTILLAAGFIQLNNFKNKSLMGYFLLGASILLSFTYAIFTNPVFRVLNILFIPIGLFSSFLLLTYSDITLELLEFVKTFLKKIIGDTLATSIKLPLFIMAIVKNEKKHKESSAYKSVVVGIAISIPVVLFLCIFLSKADSMFNYYLNSLAEYFNFDNVPDIVNQFVMALIAFFLLFGMYWSLYYKMNESKGNRVKRTWFEPVSVITLVSVVNILYLVFTKVQVSFLYGGKELPAGFSYAEYARNGFFQLVFIVVLNVLAITVIKLKTHSKSRKLDMTLYILYTTITLFTFNMAFSALYKMNLYINAFGYTRLRVMVQAFTIFLAIVLCILIIFIWKGINLFKPILVFAVIIYTALNFMNIDNYIVKRNLTVIPSESKFDANYAASLSYDAGSAMEAALGSAQITKEQYIRWIDSNRRTQKHWYEYNYYQSKLNK